MSHNHDGHDHDHDFDLDDTIVLIDEDETEHVFTILEYLEIDEQLYAVLMPQDDQSEEAFIFRVEVDENGEETLTDIEDDVAVLESDEVD